MTRHIPLLVACLAVVGGPALAQQPARPGPPPPAAPSTPGTPRPPNATSTPPAPAPPSIDNLSFGGQPVNIRVEVSIMDQSGETASPPKTVTLLLADRFESQVRSGFDDRTLNIDARPVIVDGRVRLSINIHSEPLSKVPDPVLFGSQRQTENITTMLENGRPLVVFEKSDPVSKRKLTIEVKATILK